MNSYGKLDTVKLVSADAFIAARKLRNALVHEYMQDAQTFLESLFAAQQACQMFFDIIEKAQAQTVRFGMVQTLGKNDEN